MPTSFISEHSAEFVLVPQFAEILSEITPNVTPLYFWANREGSNVAFASGTGEIVKIVALFARRPKIASSSQRFISAKFNNILFEYAKFLQPLGIPVFAGVPCVSSIKNLKIGCKCAWFHIPVNNDPYFEEFCNLYTNNLESTGTEFAKGPLTEREILKISGSLCRPLDWEKAIEHLRDARLLHSGGDYYFRIGGYKPVYFVLWD